ncbi:MAG: hypothetical protein P8129_13495 [Anaerolineae bacterium]|jgi:hypothetical protein
MQDQRLRIYLEIGKRKTFAGALDWPGWCRSGRDEAAAVEALLAYGSRYAEVLRDTGLDFQAPRDLAALPVVERLEGNGTTDFGAPAKAPAVDAEPLDDAGLARCETLLQACWSAFDGAAARAAAAEAAGQLLRTGPRGGGRDLTSIVEHVLGAEVAYLKKLGGSFEQDEVETPEATLHRLRQAVLQTLPAAARGELPARGPRGGKRWLPRYFVRRAAWHVLDHAWEIEDRLP